MPALLLLAAAAGAFEVSRWFVQGRLLPGLLLVLATAAVLVLRAPGSAVVLLTVLGATVFTLPVLPLRIGPVQSDVPELLVLALGLGLVVGWLTGRASLPSTYLRPLLLLAAAVGSGLVVGAVGGVSRAYLIGDLKPYLYYSVALTAAAAFASEARQQLLARLVVGIATVACLVVLVQAALGFTVASESDTQLYTLGTLFQAYRYRPPLLNLLPLAILLVTARAATRGITPVRAAQLALFVTVEALGFNRSSWFPILAAGLLLVVLRPGPRRHGRTLRVSMALGLLVPSLLVLAGAGLLGPTGTALSARLGSTVDSRVVRESSYEDRSAEDRSALTTLARTPVVGVGIGGLYGARRPTYRYDLGYYVYVDRPYLHNSFLFAWLQLGLLGLGAFLWLGVRVARTARRAVVELPWEVASRVLAACLALLAYGVTAVFQPYLIDRSAIVAVGLALALAQSPLRARRSDQDPSVPSGRPAAVQG